ncbi:hypothetical protein BJV82DRAFT_592284 [Fennellomyces sp. T-0311]|nr:hypothetical protein BJV82DRAFT_592284 [Fennellomyces sp. T-0311]
MWLQRRGGLTTYIFVRGYPSPPEVMKRSPPIPVPTASTPLPPRQSRHERTKSSLIDYAAQFPSTMAYANSSRIPIQSTTQNLDEALIWIQQNNRLLKENQRLKEELAIVRREKDQLEETLRDREKELQALRPDIQPRKALEEERYGRSEAKSERRSFSSYRKDGFLSSRLL